MNNEFNLTKFYGNEHILEIKAESISIDIHFNQIEVSSNESLFLYRAENENKYPSFHGYILKNKNEELVEAIVKYAEKNMIPIIRKGETIQ